MKIKLSLVTSETKNWQIYTRAGEIYARAAGVYSARFVTHFYWELVLFHIYSTVYNIKVLPPVVKKNVVILNFHGAGERAAAAEAGGANDIPIIFDRT